MTSVRSLRMPTWLGAALLVVLVGCSLAPGDASPSPHTPIERPKTVVGQLFDRLSPEGIPDKQLALEAFSLAVEPLPGVEVPTGPPPEEHELKSATFAVRWLMAYYDDLTAEQKGVVEDALSPAPDAITVHPGETSVEPLTAGFVAAAPGEYQRLTEMLNTAQTRIAQRLGRTLNLSWTLSIDDEEKDYHGLTRYLPGFGCSFNFSPSLTGRAEGDIRVVATHEMFHCFQDEITGYESKYNPNPSWISEGMAEFVGEAIAGPSSLGLQPWLNWILYPGKVLYNRSYDASGFYWQLGQSGVDPWSHLDAMLRAIPEGNDAVFKAAGAQADSFLYSWGSSYARNQPWGQPWNATALWDTPEKAFPSDETVGVGSSVYINAPRLTTDFYQVTTAADIVEVRIQGYARLQRTAGDIIGLEQVWLCTKPGGCECPEGQRYSGPDLVSASSPLYIGMTGALSGAEGELTGHELKEFCEPDESPPPDDSCDSGCPMSNGDPHIVTIDDDSYDFMSVGEFVLLRSADGSFELQARQEPYGESRTVSINTGLAMRAGTQRIGIYATDADALEVRVDGVIVDPGAGPMAVGGAIITHLPGAFFPGVEVTFADGTRLIAFGEFQYGINVTVQPGETLRAGAVGVMGPVPDGEGLDLPALPDGTVLPDVITNAEYEESLYGTFADAWRVDSASSLFDYEPDTSTETYVDQSFPDRDQLLTFDELTAEQRSAGEAACIDVTDQVLLEQCLFDVFVTGDTAFGQMYEQSLSVVETGALPSTGAQARVVNLYTENGRPVEIDVYAYTYSDTEMSEVAALVATVPYGQASDWFNPGLAQTPFSEGPYTKIGIQRHGEPPDPISPLAGVTEFLGPGTVTTIALWQEVFAGEPEEWVQTIYAEHPTYPIPEAPTGQGLLVTRTHGLAAEKEPLLLHASVGEGCLEHPLADPSFPFPQPQLIGNDLAIPAGEHTLTLHAVPPLGELPECDDEPVGAGVPLSVAPGDRFLVFPYRLPGTVEIKMLVLPFGAS